MGCQRQAAEPCISSIPITLYHCAPHAMQCSACNIFGIYCGIDNSAEMITYVRDQMLDLVLIFIPSLRLI